MCGRFTATQDPRDLAEEFEATDETPAERLEPDYNVAPTKDVYVVRRRGGGEEAHRAVTTVRWGLVPSWAKDPSVGSRFINARSESVATKPAFRYATRRRRCLVPATGWYEWAPRPHAPGKQPFYMTPEDGSPIAFAGLWEVWGSGDDRLLTCTIVTTESAGPLTQIHDRMPLVLPRRAWDEWLDFAREDVSDLLSPTPRDVLDTLELRPVGRDVGKVDNNGPRLVERVRDADVATLF